MPTNERINFKIYVPLSIILILLGYFLSNSSSEFKVIITVFIAACLNQYMLVRGVDKLTKQAASTDANQEDQSGTLLGLFLGKIFVLIVALVLGVQIMGKRIIIPVLIYVLQIGVLYLSFKKTSSDN